MSKRPRLNTRAPLSPIVLAILAAAFTAPDGAGEENVAKSNQALTVAESVANSRMAAWTGDSGEGLEDEVGSHGATLQGAATWVRGRKGHAMSFPGSGYASINSGNGPEPSSAVSLSALININQLGSKMTVIKAGRYEMFVSAWDKVVFLVKPEPWFCSQNPRACVGGRLKLASNSEVSAGQWTSVVGTFGGGNICVYIDGVQDKCTFLPSPLPNVDNSGNVPTISASASSVAFDGILDEVTIHNKSLTANEVSYLHEYNMDVPAERGLYSIWHGWAGEKWLKNQSRFIGAQAVVNWSDIESTKDNYDFSSLDEKIRKAYDDGAKKNVVIQINGQTKPSYLYDSGSGIMKKNVQFSFDMTDTYSLMYWDPDYINRYEKLIEAFGNHLANLASSNPALYKRIAGVRQQPLPFGTEHTHATKNDHLLWGYTSSYWNGDGDEFNWSESSRDDYITTVVTAFRDHVGPHARVLYRARSETAAQTAVIDPELAAGDGLMVTFSRYQNIDYSEAPYTRMDTHAGVHFAEPYSDSFGHFGSTVAFDQGLNPARVTYWRSLNDLSHGVSLLAYYDRDVRVAHTNDSDGGGEFQFGVDGTYYTSAPNTQAFRISPNDYRSGMGEALDFAANYAGYRFAPKVSPGAWVALRRESQECYHGQNCYGIPVGEQGDYNFLMTRLDPNNGVDTVEDASWAFSYVPAEAKEGHGIVRLLTNKKLRFVLDEDFARSLDGKPAKIRINHLGMSAFSGKTLDVDYHTSSGTLNGSTSLGTTWVWTTKELSIASCDFQTDANGAHITITNTAGSNVDIHMVEVRRD